MKRLASLASLAAVALTASACVTVIDTDSDYRWAGDDARPFDSSRDECRARTGSDEGTSAFVQCMAEKGWTRVRD